MSGKEEIASYTKGEALLDSSSSGSSYPAGTDWIAIVNTKSGGQGGKELLAKFAEGKILPEDQIFGLIPEGPEAAVQKWAEDPERYKLVVCGGDGTVGWVLSVAEKLTDSAPPVVGVIPLGTGNDLARVFGWGGGYSGEDLKKLMKKFAKAKTMLLDRWLVDVQPLQESDTETKAKIAKAHSTDHSESDQSDDSEDEDEEESAGKGKEAEPETEEVDLTHLLKDGPKAQTHIMNNYFSIGVDAEIALSFHKMREANTKLFQSQLVNKGWYSALGAKTILKPHRAIRRSVLLEVDGKEIKIPRKVRGILVLNMPSYASGTQPWGNKREAQYKDPAINDGVIEVLGLKSALHLARIQTHTSAGKGVRLAQGKSITLTVRRPLPAQVDGEPWMMAVGTVTITHANQAHLLYNVKAKDAEKKELLLNGARADA